MTCAGALGGGAPQADKQGVGDLWLRDTVRSDGLPNIVQGGVIRDFDSERSCRRRREGYRVALLKEHSECTDCEAGRMGAGGGN